MTHGIEGVSCSAVGVELAIAGGYVAPAEIFKAIPKGHNAAIIDPDGGVRKSPALSVLTELSIHLSRYQHLCSLSLLRHGQLPLVKATAFLAGGACFH